ncbi:MAG: hypothetical protein ACKO5R_15445 [Planctomycetaceae bacterium]
MEGDRRTGATAAGGGGARRPWLAASGAVAVALAVAAIAAPAQEGEPFRSPGGVRTGIFGLETRGNRFVYVFDRSASMADPDGRPLAAAKRELLRSLDELGDVQQFHVIFYNDRHQVFTPEGGRGRAVFATEANRRAARRFVESVRPAGGTRHAEPLAAAFQLAPDAVFLLTDADAGDDLEPAEIERLVRLADGARCMVVQFGDGDRRSPGLADMAARCGGEYRVVSLEDAEAAARGGR